MTKKPGNKGNRRKKGEKFPNIPLTLEEIELMKLYSDGFREKTIIHLLLNTGMRRSDFVRIKWSQINLKEGNYSYYSKKTKKLSIVYLAPDTIKYLKLHKKTQRKTKNDKVFNFKANRLNQIIKEIKERAGITYRKVSPHDFCDTAITYMLEKGLTPKAVSEITGKTIQTILTHYTKHSPEKMKEYMKSYMEIFN